MGDSDQLEFDRDQAIINQAIRQNGRELKRGRAIIITYAGKQYEVRRKAWGGGYTVSLVPDK